MQSFYGSTYPLTNYCLGAMLQDFPRAATKFLALESYYGNDVAWAIWPYEPSAKVLLPNLANTDYPRYADPVNTGGIFSFRHTVPRSTDRYMAECSANFLFADGHVEVLFPTAVLNTVDRFSFK
jgi:prepilin-type processing-associated H-X9-DG protein